MEAKRWYVSKLVWLGIIQIAIGVLGLVATFLEVGVYTPAAFVILVMGVLTIILRFVTAQPIE